jgi:deoxyribose-phosphate aldolase
MGELDNLVETIAREAVLRMQGAATFSSAKDPGFDPALPCLADAASCNGCGFCVTRKKDDVSKIIAQGADRIGAAPGGVKPSEGLASYIDHTLLKPDATQTELQKVCEEARKWHFATVCVNSANIAFVARELEGSVTKPIAVVGFPLGASVGTAKAFEARQAVRSGAREIDMVINIGALKSRDYETVLEDICRVVEASKPWPVKVILETGSLNEEQKIIGCALSKAGGAAFVKTSTGFGPGGATVEDIALMRRVVGDEMGVKASGGVRTREDAEAMIKAGANRIGASASVAIVTGKKGTSSY